MADHEPPLPPLAKFAKVNMPSPVSPSLSATWDDTLLVLLLEGRYAPCSSPLEVESRVQTVQKCSAAVHGIRWYRGRVSEVDPEGPAYTIEYDDNEISVLIASDPTEIILPELTAAAVSRLDLVTDDSIAKLNVKALAHAKKILGISEAAAAREAAEERAEAERALRLHEQARNRKLLQTMVWKEAPPTIVGAPNPETAFHLVHLPEGVVVAVPPLMDKRAAFQTLHQYFGVNRSRRHQASRLAAATSITTTAATVALAAHAHGCWSPAERVAAAVEAAFAEAEEEEGEGEDATRVDTPAAILVAIATLNLGELIGEVFEKTGLLILPFDADGERALLSPEAQELLQVAYFDDDGDSGETALLVGAAPFEHIRYLRIALPGVDSGTDKDESHLPSADLYFTEHEVPGGAKLADLGRVARVRTRREGHIVAVAADYHHGHGNGVFTDADRVGAELLVANAFSMSLDASFGARLKVRHAHDEQQAWELLAEEINFIQSLEAPPEQPEGYTDLTAYAADAYDRTLAANAITGDDKAGGESGASGWRVRGQTGDDKVHSIVDDATLYVPHVKAIQLQGGDEATTLHRLAAAVAPFLGLAADGFDARSPDVTLELKAGLDDGNGVRMHPNFSLQRCGRPVAQYKVGKISATNLVVRKKGSRDASVEEYVAAMNRQVGLHSDMRDTKLGVLVFIPVGGAADGVWAQQRDAAVQSERRLGLLLRLRGGAAAKTVRVQAPRKRARRKGAGLPPQRYVPG